MTFFMAPPTHPSIQRVVKLSLAEGLGDAALLGNAPDYSLWSILGASFF